MAGAVGGAVGGASTTMACGWVYVGQNTCLIVAMVTSCVVESSSSPLCTDSEPWTMCAQHTALDTETSWAVVIWHFAVIFSAPAADILYIYVSGVM